MTMTKDLEVAPGDYDDAVDENPVVPVVEATRIVVVDDARKSRKQSSIFAEREGHSLEFDNIRLSTKGGRNPDKNPPKHILKGLTGCFPPKTLTAVMGPSGSGKTSLLKVLTGRIGSKLELNGEIRLDHKAVNPKSIEVRREIAYVEQDVSVPATCTPREAIGFSARLRLHKSLSDEDIDEVVEDILDNLGLQKCADTMIGGGMLMKGGLSGGEKKRVQCGVELVTNPEIIVLDEPTSGLDSYSAQNLMDVLQKIAQSGATVIVTIHQPPPPVVRKIDNLLLLLGGRLMYGGPMGLPVEEKFGALGYPKPDDYNIADWILHAAQANPIEVLEEAGFFDGSNELTKSTRSSGDAQQSSRNADVAAKQLDDVDRPGFLVQLRLLFDREVKKLVRDKVSLLVRVGSVTVFGFLFGFIFLHVGKSDYENFSEVQASSGAIANLLISTMFGVAQSSLREFPTSRPVFLREYSTNHYGVIPYFLSKFSLECVTVFFQCLFQLLAAFFLMGFQMNFFLFLALNFTLGVASTSIGIFIGSSVEDPNVAQELMPALIVPQLLFAGFFIPVNMIPAFLRWAQYVCSLTYAVRLTAHYEYGDCTTEACEGYLAMNGVDEMPPYVYWFILIAIIAIFRLASIIMLRSKATF